MEAETFGPHKSIPSKKDIFDDVLSLEETFVSEGYKDGVAKGVEMGRQEGGALGRTFGQKVGLEIGFYAGCVEAWFALAERHPEYFNERTMKSLRLTKKLITKFPLIRPQDNDMNELLTAIRAKVRLLSSRLKMPLTISSFKNILPVPHDRKEKDDLLVDRAFAISAKERRGFSF